MQSTVSPVASRKSQRVRVYDCCGRYHAGPLHLQAPDPEALMRSRYSAFVLDLRDYLMATWHPDHRPASIDLTTPFSEKALRRFLKRVPWPWRCSVEYRRVLS